MSVGFKKSVFAGLISACLLAACGGGGGGTSASNPGSNSNSGSGAVGVITSTNAQDAVAYAYSGVQDLGTQSSTGASLATGVSVETPTAGLITASLAQLYKGLGVQPVNNLVAGVTTSAASACASGGTISVSVTAANPGIVSNGDSMTITANSCSENGEVINGQLTYGFNNLSGTIGSSTQWSATLTLNYNNLTLQSGGITIAANGDMSLGYSQTDSQHATATVSGSSLQMNLTQSNGTVISRKLTAYSFNGSIAGTTNTSSANFTLTGSSPTLGSVSYTVKTKTPFQAIGSANPSVGSMTVTANNSSATLTVIDSTNVKIDIDSNGDGVIDQTINTTWADLNSRI
ncbi:hypothetical protein LJ655_06150 [Paraburkholderia sp. MMS20-SJTN17]|uniref:Uncharacterized protein n=1 Tax=Paraburkholderia translucens TaxID=2886945 RepID=A0ABS8K9S3_9BURK|nr:hypothetical protein [Paraburkholderia sp. MMS20-SJTN17]MCC8401479.1 hypothetical protein [Paraburkholderia sp. MMS20-SJTN17]